MRWSLTTGLASGTTTLQTLQKQLRRVCGEVDPSTGKRRDQLIEKDLKTDDL